ncbi:TetR/AcrR family transcriptional regulator [Paraburkholderia sp. JHI869]|uniref:TetR/AcrR family transcriptional regulator n=1 Tax=Paraburkholderia sp. JHI869 TaxID=3112959 RepID=UPI00317A763A
MNSVVEDPLLVAKRRNQLTLAAITLFSREGFHKATVKEIAEEAGVSPGTRATPTPQPRGGSNS